MARHYKKGRVSRKGKTPYDIYLDKRQQLQAEGYTLRPAMNKEYFDKTYQNAKLAGKTNFMRDVAKYDRYSSKSDFYDLKRRVKHLDLGDAMQGDLYNKYYDLKWEDMKTWDNKDWTVLRDDMVAVGLTYAEFRGIYE